jgi:hypothetical protein
MTPEQIRELKEFYRLLGLDTSLIEKNLEEAGKNQKYLTEQLKAAREYTSDTEDSFKNLSQTLTNVVRDLNRFSTTSRDVNKSFSKLDSLAKSLRYDQQEISTLSLKELKNTKQKIQIEVDNLKNLKEELKTKQKNGDITSDEIGKLTELNSLFDEQGNLSNDIGNYIQQAINLTDKRIKQEEKINKTLGLTGAAVDGIVGALGKIGIDSSYFEDLKENMKEAAKSGNGFKVALVAAQGLAKGIGKALTDPIAILTFLFQQGLKANKQTTEIGKSLGISYNSAANIRKEFAEYSKNVNDGFITTDRLVQAQGELTAQLGIAVKYSEQELNTFSRLVDLVGLTTEEAGNLTQQAAALGKENSDYVADLREAAFYAQQTSGIHVEDKELLQSISKLSAGILVKFQGNSKALVESVIQAKKLGLNLDQVNKIGQSMLDWESSIEAELEAELITGKKLNFERARAAALTGDQATLMQEVASQAGSLAEFQNMNVLAQESLAKAFGMSSDEMAEMLMKQEAINTYGSKAQELNAQQLKDFEKSGLSLDEFLKQQNERQNAQEKFNKAIEKLQDIVGNLVAGPFGKLLGILADAVNLVSKMASWIAIAGESLGGLTGVFVGLIPLLLKGSFIMRSFALAGFRAGVASIFKTFAQIPMGLGIPLAIAAVAGLTSLFSSKGDDVVSDGGYGNRTLTTPKGTIKLNNQDTVIAGTNLFDKGRPSAAGNAGMMAAINNLVTAVSNKPTPTPQFALNVDGQQLGNVIGRQQETGTQQTKNAYRVA